MKEVEKGDEEVEVDDEGQQREGGRGIGEGRGERR